VAGNFVVITNSPDEDVGEGSIDNTIDLLPTPLTSKSTTVNTGCDKMTGSTLCDLKV
jgi:hypothetical protein